VNQFFTPLINSFLLESVKTDSVANAWSVLINVFDLTTRIYNDFLQVVIVAKLIRLLLSYLSL